MILPYYSQGQQLECGITPSPLWEGVPLLPSKHRVWEELRSLHLIIAMSFYHRKINFHWTKIGPLTRALSRLSLCQHPPHSIGIDEGPAISRGFYTMILMAHREP